jgi:hypothetical protein
MTAFDVYIHGDPSQVRTVAVQALEGRGFRFTWTDDWHALAEKGSKVGNALGGALAQYYAIEVQVMAGPQPGQSIVRFTQGNTGWMGGAIGASRVKKAYGTLRDEFVGWFHQQGLLAGVQDHP